LLEEFCQIWRLTKWVHFDIPTVPKPQSSHRDWLIYLHERFHLCPADAAFLGQTAAGGAARHPPWVVVSHFILQQLFNGLLIQSGDLPVAFFFRLAGEGQEPDASLGLTDEGRVKLAACLLSDPFAHCRHYA